MNPAWQVRAYQRQELLQDLMQLVYEEQEVWEQDDGRPTIEACFFDLAKAIGNYLCYGTLKEEELTEVEGFFAEDILPKILKFRRTDAEQKYILSEFYRQLAANATESFRRELLREEIENPQAVFHAPSTMADVELPPDEE